jgi:UDP-N-acetylmuramate dehydrogenase
MKLFGDLRRITRFDEAMKHHTSLRVGGTVRYFIEPESPDELRLVYQRCHGAGLRIRVLGRGSNVLVDDGYHDWAVISTGRLNRYQRAGNRIRVDAGFSLRRLVALAERWGLGGLEALAGIPGSVGGAVAMNAGGHTGNIGDRLVSARVAFPSGPPCEMDVGELALGYRCSYLVDGRPCLLLATFELDTAPTARLEETRRAVVAQKRASQPVDAYSAGCVFKNPRDGSAGKLIDQAGLKGAVVGDAVVSDQHANCIITRGRATATDVLTLIDLVVQRVHEIHGIWLELEVEVWRNDHQDAHTTRPAGKERR